MKPEPFCTSDIVPFLECSLLEKWVVQQWEMEFLIDVFPAGCLVERDDNGRAIGFITAIPHTRSGWIGNLIVAADHRGQGIGASLFQASLRALRHAGIATVWLTASNSGRHMYEKHGFTRIDTIHRWKGLRSGIAGTLPDGTKTAGTARAVSIDREAWGDNREKLLRAVMSRGVSRCTDAGFVTLQECDGRYQIGPFAAHNERSATELLASAIGMAPAGADIYLDVPESNRSASFLLYRMGLKICGVNELMYLGEPPAYRPELLYGLATMGSCG